MDDYLNLLKEYDEINSIYKSIRGDYNAFERYIDQFFAAISLLIKPKINEKNLKDSDLIVFIEKYSIFVEKLKIFNDAKNNELMNSSKQVYEKQNTLMGKVLESFNKLKDELFEGKLKVIKAKNDYIQILNENPKTSKIKNDNDEFYDLSYENKKNNLYLLYKSEIEKLNEKIEKSNEKYKKLKQEIDSILSLKEIAYLTILLKFSNIVGNIGNLFIEFNNNLSEKLQKSLKESINIIQIENEERFQKEKLETEEDLELRYKDKNKDEENNINNNKKNKKIEDFKNNEIKNNKNIEGINNEIKNEFNNSKNPSLVDIIENLLDEKPISSFDESSLIKNIKSNKDSSLKFIKEIEKRQINDSITLKNRQNLISLSNLLNEIILSSEKNFDIIVEILEISQKIKFNDLLISSILKKKNKIISSKNFWISFIDNNITINLKKYIKDVIANKQMNIEVDNNSNQKISQNIVNLLNSMNSFKKLNKKQKTQVQENSMEFILYAISNSVKLMSNFSLPQYLIMDIINHYVGIFNLGIEIYYYFENILNIKFQRNILKMNSLEEQTKEKYGLFLTKEQLIILNVAKFLPKIEYIKLFTLNKSVHSKIRKYLIRYRLTYLDISIDERIKLWEILLNIKEIRKKYNYNVIKKNYLINSGQINYYGPQKRKFLEIIDLDLARTSLFNSQETHKIKANFILKCAAIIEPDINYYQGMNYILLFIYQVLNYDEERTFYIFWALLKKTKFLIVFDNEMENLNTNFKVFEKIIEYNYPDIYKLFSSQGIITQFFATDWFITLFSVDAMEFDRNKIPKFLILAFESFLYYGWTGSINLGLSLCLYNKEKIMKLTGSILMSFMNKELNCIKNYKEEDFPKIKKIFINNAEKIDGTYIEKIINVINFEEEHPILTNRDIE